MTGPIRRLGADPYDHTTPVLGSRQAVGFMLARHPDLVKKWGEPVACDVKTKAPLYDAEQVEAALKDRRRINDQDYRRRRVACA
jgi:hypothetical protein